MLGVLLFQDVDLLLYMRQPFLLIKILFYIFHTLNVCVFVSKAYVAVVGFISFAVCYRHGPLVDKRSVNILSWTLQIFGLLLIYAGIQVQQVALAIMVAAFCSKNLEYPVSMAITICQ